MGKGVGVLLPEIWEMLHFFLCSMLNLRWHFKGSEKSCLKESVISFSPGCTHKYLSMEHFFLLVKFCGGSVPWNKVEDTALNL